MKYFNHQNKEMMLYYFWWIVLYRELKTLMMKKKYLSEFDLEIMKSYFYGMLKHHEVLSQFVDEISLYKILPSKTMFSNTNIYFFACYN